MPRDGDHMPREWFSAGDIAALSLPGMPTTKGKVLEMAAREAWQRPEWEGTHWRQRVGRGGGVEFHVACLPLRARAQLIHAEHVAAGPTLPQRLDSGMWAWFDRQPEAKKAKARQRLVALEAVEDMMRAGTGRVHAMQAVARAEGITLSSLYNWRQLVQGLDRCDWLAALAPRHAGKQETAEIDPDAWSWLLGDYLRPEAPNFTDCYRRLQKEAAAKGWSIPAARTLMRRLQDVPEQVRVLNREGAEAMKRLFPAQQRDRGVFHALEGINGDGHVWDVFVRWPDGTIGRPNMVVFQDLYSGKWLSWRTDRALSWHLVRLAFGDLVENYGIPSHCWLDNGREFASKKITGGQANRYRFKLKQEEPEGLMTSLGVEVHWTTPYHGQAKPIERSFRDMAHGLAKHPAFAGAYTGNSPMAKPENYAKTAVPLETFLQVVNEGIAEHNARVGRRSTTTKGRSFDETFNESYARHAIRRATPEQRRLWLLAAEAVSARSTNGEIHFLNNRYWSEFLLAYRGRKVVARFDPDNVHKPLHVYSTDGRYLGAAECQEVQGFNSVPAAAEHARKLKAYTKHTREANKALGALAIEDIAADLAKHEKAILAPPEPKLVRLVTGNTALQPLPVETPQHDQQEELVLAAMRAAHAKAAGRGVLHLVADDESE